MPAVFFYRAEIAFGPERGRHFSERGQVSE